jgi:hypothetical protein
MRPSVRLLVAGLFVSSTALTPHAARAAVAQLDIAAIRGDQSRQLLGEGRGIVVGIVDGGVTASHPALAGSLLAAKDFSRSGTTNDNPYTVGHGTGIMSIFLGHDLNNGFIGLAPGAKFVNARVVNKTDGTNDNLIGNGIAWDISKGAKVINLSLGHFDTQPDLNKLNMMMDYVTEKYGTVFVVAAGNENSSAVSGAPNGQYNSFTVGATYGATYDRVTVFSNYAVPTDLRTKPDLVAPGQGDYIATSNWKTSAEYVDGAMGTSFAAPMVGGVVTQLMGYGKAHHLSVDPLALKAVMMTGASKVTHYEGGGWTARHQIAAASGTTIDQPLDEEQGAGRVDGVGAYDVYTHHTDSGTVYSNWTLSGLKENGVYSMSLGKLKAGQHIDTTLTWLRHISRKDAGPSGLDSSDRFSLSTTLANFSLTLLLNGRKVVTSSSNWDNLDFLSQDVPQSGTYSLLVNRLAGSGLPVENFGLAARVLANASVGTAQSAMEKAQFGTFAANGVQQSFTGTPSVPEPTGLLVLIGASCIVMRRRR